MHFQTHLTASHQSNSHLLSFTLYTSACPCTTPRSFVTRAWHDEHVICEWLLQLPNLPVNLPGTAAPLNRMR